MHDSRMIAEVAPPGVCAIPKVSGSRIATPLAPPRPGSTPMITPEDHAGEHQRDVGQRERDAEAMRRAWISSMLSSAPAATPSGPLGSGTLNQISKMTKNTTTRRHAHRATFHQAYLPSQRMKKAMNTTEEA